MAATTSWVDHFLIAIPSLDVPHFSRGVTLVCEHDDHLLDTIARIRAVDGVEATETFVYLGLRKQTYAWGTRRPDRVAEPEA